MSVNEKMTAIADAIRAKTGGTGTLTLDQMPAAITSITSAPNLQSKSVTYTANGTDTVTPDAGYDGLSSVDVEVNVSGGGGVETCMLTTSVFAAPGITHGTIYAYSGDTVITITSAGTYSINKNSLICIGGAHGTDEVSGMDKLFYSQSYAACNVTSDVATYQFA